MDTEMVTVVYAEGHAQGNGNCSKYGGLADDEDEKNCNEDQGKTYLEGRNDDR